MTARGGRRKARVRISRSHFIASAKGIKLKILQVRTCDGCLKPDSDSASLRVGLVKPVDPEGFPDQVLPPKGLALLHQKAPKGQRTLRPPDCYNLLQRFVPRPLLLRLTCTPVDVLRLRTGISAPESFIVLRDVFQNQCHVVEEIGFWLNAQL